MTGSQWPRSVADQDWAPAGVDIRIPNVARMYDYFLGGKDHFEADRETAEELAAAAPEVRQVAVENRRFLQRAVRFLAAEVGIRQFIDLGTGLPTKGNVHEVAAQSQPEAHVVYVDSDPVVLAHGRALLSGTDSTIVVQADIRDPYTVLTHPQVRDMIDFTEPTAVLFVSVLHFIGDEYDPAGIVARFRDAVPAGSYLAVTHATPGNHADAAGAARAYDRATQSVTVRSRETVRALFDGFELVQPGLVNILEWRTDTPTTLDNEHEAGVFYGGVARKP